MFFTHLASPNPSFAAKVFQNKFDVTLLHTKPEVAAQERMVDDGSGKTEVSLMIHTPGQAGRTGPPGCSAVEEAGDSGSVLLPFFTSGTSGVFSQRCPSPQSPHNSSGK